MGNWHLSDWYLSDWYLSDWHLGNWHLGNWHWSDWYLGNRYWSNWQLGNRHLSNRHWSNRHWSDWHFGNWHLGNWHLGNWHWGNWHWGNWHWGNWRGVGDRFEGLRRGGGGSQLGVSGWIQGLGLELVPFLDLGWIAHDKGEISEDCCGHCVVLGVGFFLKLLGIVRRVRGVLRRLLHEGLSDGRMRDEGPGSDQSDLGVSRRRIEPFKSITFQFQGQQYGPL